MRIKIRNTGLAIISLFIIILLSGCSRPDVEKMAADNDIDGLISALGYDKGDAESYDDEIRKSASDALVAIGAPAVDSLIEAMDDKNDQIRDSAIDILADIKDERAIAPLIKALDDEETEMAALYALCKIGNIETIEVLEKYMDQEIVTKGGLIEINLNYIEPVLDGNGVDTTPYDPDEAGIHPVVITDDGEFLATRLGGFKTDPVNWNEYLPSDWQALGEPESIELVLCWGETEIVQLGEKHYGPADAPIIGIRTQEKRTVYLREAASGTIIASTILTGEEPDKLPEAVWDDWDDFEKTGEVTPEIVIAWLKPFVEK